VDRRLHRRDYRALERGAPRPYAQASNRRTLVEATGYRPSLRRRYPRAESSAPSDFVLIEISKSGEREGAQV
jgi:hypothetical protein